MAIAIVAAQNTVLATVSSVSNVAEAFSILALPVARTLLPSNQLWALRFCFAQSTGEPKAAYALSAKAFAISVAVFFAPGFYVTRIAGQASLALAPSFPVERGHAKTVATTRAVTQAQKRGVSGRVTEFAGVSRAARRATELACKTTKAGVA